MLVYAGVAGGVGGMALTAEGQHDAGVVQRTGHVEGALVGGRRVVGGRDEQKGRRGGRRDLTGGVVARNGPVVTVQQGRGDVRAEEWGSLREFALRPGEIIFAIAFRGVPAGDRPEGQLILRW